MVLTVDVGNTNITCGVFEGSDPQFVFRLSTDRRRTADQYAVEFSQIFSLRSIDASRFTGAVMGSVVPELSRTISGAVKLVTGSRPLEVGPGVKTGINIKIDDPATLGADLLIGAVAAADKYELPCLIVDLGTATKITVVDENKSFLGGVIAPGVKMSLGALSGGASKLPSISLDTPKNVIGTNTVDCMRSGSVLGTAAMIDGICAMMERELGRPVRSTVATGGIARHIIGSCSREMTHDPNLLLRGLRIIGKKNGIE